MLPALLGRLVPLVRSVQLVSVALRVPLGLKVYRAIQASQVQLGHKAH